MLLLNIVTLFILPRSAFSFLCLILQPQVLADPTSIDFGSTNLDTPKTVSMTVTYTSGRIYIDGVCSCNCSNPGSSSVTITSSSPTTFSVNPSSFTLAEGESRTVEVTFSPTTASGEGNYTGSLEIDPSASGAGTITVSLAGVGYKPKPNINVTPTSFEFGSQPVNSEAGQTLTISNEGDAALDGSLFLFAPFSASPASFSIAPAASRSFTIKFKPTSRGTALGNLTVASNDPDSPSLLLGLSGTGVAPYLSVSPSALDFGTVPVGESAARTLTISNQNNSDSTTLTLSSFQTTNAQFSFSGPESTSLAPGGSTTVQVTLTPTSSGTKSGSLTFQSNDPDHASNTVALTGAAVSPSIDPSTLNLSFGDVHLGTTATQTLTISNKGSLSLTISGVASSSSSVNVTPTSATIAAGGSQNFSVQYHPTAASLLNLPYTVLNGSLTVSSNDPQLPSLTVLMTGRGVSPYLNVAALDFGTVYAGDLRTLSLVLENAGNEELVVQSLSSNLTVFIPAQSTVTIPAGETRTVDVRYQPPSEGTHAATLTLASNDYFNPSRTVSASGQAVPSLDLSISKIEVTQAIQTPDNTVPIVWGKKTVVRTNVASTIKGSPNVSNVIRNVDGLLHLYKDGVEAAGSPLQSTNGPISVVPAPDRKRVNDTLNFLIPPDLMKKVLDQNEDVALEARVELNPAAGARVPRLKENSYDNNSFSKTLSFGGNYIPTIYYVPVTQTDSQGRAVYPLPPSRKMLDGTSLLRKIFPVPGINYLQRPPLGFKKEINQNNAYDLFAALFFASHLGNVTPPDRTYGWIPEPLTVGFAEDIPGRVAFGGRLSDLDGPVGAQLVFAHELGHTYGLCHTHTLEATEVTPTGSVTHCPVDYSDGHQVEDGTSLEVGFDPEKGETIVPLPLDQWMLCVGSKPAWNQCLGQGALDFMSYGPSKYRRWIHPQRYEFLHRIFRDRFFEPSNARGCNNLIACEKKEPALLIAGFISEEGEAALHPIYAAESVPDTIPETATPSPYQLRALAQNGEPLFEYPLELGGQAGFQQTDRDLSTFSLVVPDLPGLETIQIVKGEEIVAERSKTNHPPLLSLLSPQGGEEFEKILEVRWSASDADGDSLISSVLYSADGGTTFSTIAVDLSGTSFQYDVSKLPGSSSGVVRVITTDGFHTAVVDSSPFRISSKPPQVLILAPREGETVFAGTRISLEAATSDPEDGEIASDQVTWKSSLTGDLGKGNPLSAVLPLGVHTVSATAADRDGNEAASQVQIFVVDGVHAPRADAGPDQTVSEGETVLLDASQSTDPDEGEGLRYEWRQVEGPAVTLDDLAAAIPQFTAPEVLSDSLLRFLLTVTDDQGNIGTDSVEVAVSNTNFPSLALSEKELDFGTVNVGDSARRTVLVTNAGNEPLEVTGVELSRTVFAAASASVTLRPGDSASFTVTFTPDEDASYEGTLRVQSNTVSGVPSTVVLKGTTPDPKFFYNDNGVGGSLLPEEFSETSGNPQPGSSPQEGQSGKTPDPGSFGFVGTGGCSLVAR